MPIPLPQMPRPVGGETHANATLLSIPTQWQPLLTRACELKEAFDHLLRWPSSAGKPWVAQCLAANGLRPEDALAVVGKVCHNFPDHFAGILMGSWYEHQPISSEFSLGWCRIPPWAVLGWVRKEHYQDTPELSLQQLQCKAAQVDALSQSDIPTTYGFDGIPLLWAGEGKNRTQLFRLADVPRASVLSLSPRPRFEKCRVRPLFLFPSIAVIEYGSGGNDILPFGDLSIDLLTAVGVSRHRRPSLRGLWTLFSELRELHGTGRATRYMAAGSAMARCALLKRSR